MTIPDRIWVRETGDVLGYEVCGVPDAAGLAQIEPGWREYTATRPRDEAVEVIARVISPGEHWEIEPDKPDDYDKQKARDLAGRIVDALAQGEEPDPSHLDYDDVPYADGGNGQ